MGEKIYIWRSAELAKELASGQVTEKQKAIYLFADIMIVLFLLYVFIPPANSDILMFAEGIVVLLIAISGFFISYQKNGGNSGKYFLDYFVCLTLPLFLKVNIVIWAVYGAFYHLTGLFLRHIPEQYYPVIDSADELITSISIVIAFGAFFSLMATHIKRIHLKRAR